MLVRQRIITVLCFEDESTKKLNGSFQTSGELSNIKPLIRLGREPSASICADILWKNSIDTWTFTSHWSIYSPTCSIIECASLPIVRALIDSPLAQGMMNYFTSGIRTVCAFFCIGISFSSPINLPAAPGSINTRYTRTGSSMFFKECAPRYS